MNVLYGAGGGLSGTGAQVFFQVGGTPESGDRFGSALAAGDFNTDSFADLAAGAPFERVGSTFAACGQHPARLGRGADGHWGAAVHPGGQRP